jgi:Ca2+/Na+ antiporter
MDSLFRATGILLGIVLLTLLIALITGPYPWAVTVRGWLRDGARGIASAVGGHPTADTDRVRWLRVHRDALMLAGGVVALLLLLLFNLSWLAFVIVTVLIALYEIALARLGHEPEEAEPA